MSTTSPTSPTPTENLRAGPRSTSGPLGRRVRARLDAIWPPLVVFVIAMILWQVLPPALGAQSYILPTPSEVWAAIRENSGEFWQGVFTTSWTSLVGFALSGILGVLVACVMATWRPIERTLFPYMVLLSTVPIIAVAPLIIVWFGFGSKSILIIAVIVGFFPVVANMVVGLHSASTSSVDLFRIYHASTFQTLFKLRFWTALPFLMAALRVTATLAVIGTIVGEYVAGVGGSGGGLGYIIVVANNRLETSFVFAAAIASCVVGILFFWIVGWLSGRVLGSWHESAIRGE
jgi:NitT/TauT family transport system permease protein